uniref:Uncharacterized protein n=1 Tax=Mustela putorius furo TaxID=9669 RepID=M3XV63_MUSPF
MGTAQVLPGILQKHCCILPDRNTEDGSVSLMRPRGEVTGDPSGKCALVPSACGWSHWFCHRSF